jgi:uncharacterized membrane protein
MMEVMGGDGPMRRFRQGELGWLLIKGLCVALVILLIGLLLDSFGLNVGGYVVLGACALYVLVAYLLPFWPTRRE